MFSLSSTAPAAPRTTYAPRTTDTLKLIFHDHFHAFSDAYDSLYAHKYGKFRLDRISRVVERFESCGDYTWGYPLIRLSLHWPECPDPGVGMVRGPDEYRDVVLPDHGPASVFARPGTFFLFWPEDAHMPGIAAEAPEQCHRERMNSRKRRMRLLSS